MQLYTPKTARFFLIAAIVTFFFIPMVWTDECSQCSTHHKTCDDDCQKIYLQERKPIDEECNKKCFGNGATFQESFFVGECVGRCKKTPEFKKKLAPITKTRKECREKCKTTNTACLKKCGHVHVEPTTTLSPLQALLRNFPHNLLKPSVPRPKPSVPEPKPSVPEPKPYVPEPKPSVPVPKPSVPVPKPSVHEPKPSVPASETSH